MIAARKTRAPARSKADRNGHPAPAQDALAQAGLNAETMGAVEQLVVACGGLVRELLAFTGGSSAVKDGTGQRVTAADAMADRLLRDRLPELLPGSGGYSEEGGFFGAWEAARVRWLVDPLDGTRPATLGGAFGISVAALVYTRGEVTAAAGWVYVPSLGALYRGLLAPDRWESTRNGLPVHADGEIAAADLPFSYLAAGSDWHRAPLARCPMKLSAPGATAVHLTQLVQAGSDVAAVYLSRYRPYDAAGGLAVAAGGGASVYPVAAGGQPSAEPSETLRWLGELAQKPSVLAPRALVCTPEVRALLA